MYESVKTEEKIRLADAIPTFGHGGKSIRDHLVDAASLVQPGEFILDAGPFLGSTTAYLLIGAHPEAHVISLDNWKASKDLVFKAHDRIEPPLELEEGRDLLPLWKFYTSPFRTAIPLQMCAMDLEEWPYGRIALFVNDLNAEYEIHKHLMDIIEPHMKRNAHMILMDYYMYENRTDRDGLKNWYEQEGYKAWNMELQRTTKAAFFCKKETIR